MTKQELFVTIGTLRTRTHQRLNDIHIWSSLALVALKRAQSDNDLLNQHEFVVPSSKAEKIIVRGPDKVKKILSDAAPDLDSAVLVYITAHVEAFLNDVISLVLQFDTRRLKTRVQGIETPKSIDVIEIVDCASKEGLINRVVEKYVLSLFYAKPSLQFDYLNQVIGVDVRQDVKEAWIEQKASRDLIIHNSGIINDIYLQKCAARARGKSGEQIVIDREYFEQSLANSKSLIGTVSSQLQRIFKVR